MRDPVRSSKFYCKIFGMEEAFSELPRAIFLRCGSDLLTLARTKRRPRSEGMHFGFQAKDKADYDMWKSWLRKNKVSITSGRQEEKGGGMYFKDPDGYTLEIYYEM
ncbi:MAG: VOC family protein [Nitrososphaerales archaeon]|nr:VOC family protein [Nitrososphaerales archaeon]